MVVGVKLESSGASRHTFLLGQTAYVTHRPISSYREVCPNGPAPFETHQVTPELEIGRIGMCNVRPKVSMSFA